MNRRIAILDLGTNVFHLLIANIEAGKVTVLHNEDRSVKLGEGGINSGVITESSFDRGIQAMQYFNEHISSLDVTEVYAVGTSAIRTASNGEAFVNEVFNKTGIRIEMINGDREAELIFKAVQQALHLSEPALIMDIGGGSVEFIFCDKNELICKKSYPIGAARLLEQFHRTDPITEAEILSIFRHLDSELEDLKTNAHMFKPHLLIGSAGAFETFTAMIIRKSGLAPIGGQTSVSFSVKQLKDVLNDIIKSKKADREANPDIIPVRVDMIVSAAVLTSYILEELQISDAALSTYSLKEGLLYDKIA